MPEFIEYFLDCGFLLDHADDKLKGVEHAGSVPNGKKEQKERRNTKQTLPNHRISTYCTSRHTHNIKMLIADNILEYNTVTVFFIYCCSSSILIGPALTQYNHSKHHAHADLS